MKEIYDENEIYLNQITIGYIKKMPNEEARKVYRCCGKKSTNDG